MEEDVEEKDKNRLTLGGQGFGQVVVIGDSENLAADVKPKWVASGPGGGLNIYLLGCMSKSSEHLLMAHKKGYKATID